MCIQVLNESSQTVHYAGGLLQWPILFYPHSHVMYLSWALYHSVSSLLTRSVSITFVQIQYFDYARRHQYKTV
jgi:hypothetical protein